MNKIKKMPGYGESYKELQSILSTLEQGEIDVDDLSQKVRRAAELIEFCQKRLRETEMEVKGVVERFENQLKIGEQKEGERE